MKINSLVCLLSREIGSIHTMQNQEVKEEYRYFFEEMKKLRKFLVPFHLFESLLNSSVEDFRKVSREYYLLIEYLEKYKIIRRFHLYTYHSYEPNAESKSDMQEMFFDLNDHIENRFHNVNQHFFEVERYL